jgi:hypothetical protein
MSRGFKAFREAIKQEGNVKRFFRKHTPGSRVFPPKSKDNDGKYQLRVDAGEFIDGMKTIYLQVNRQERMTC